MSLELTSLDSLTAEDVQTKKAVITELLCEAFPGVDIARGALSEVVGYLMAVLMAKTSKELERYRSARSLLDIKADPTLADEDCVDQVLSNFNVLRKSAESAHGVLTLEFRRDLSTLIPVNTKFTCGGDTYVNPEGAVVYASTSNASNTLTLLANGRYAVQIPVTAETSGAKSPVKAGDVFGTELADVVSVYAQSDFTAGSDAESNSALTTRLASGMATSCWGNRYHAEALIRQQVPTVCAVSIAGFGDVEMTRDQLVCLPISIGGKADIYVKTAMESRIYSCIANFVRMKGVSEEWTVNIPASAFPGCYRATAAKKDGSSYPVASQQVISGAEGTADQVLCITFLKDDLSAARTADTFDIVLEGQSDINTVADIFTSESLKPVTEDVRVISARPAFVNLTVYLSQYADNEDAIRAALSSAIDSSGFCGKLSLSELLTAALPCLVSGQKIWEIRSSVELWGFDNMVYRSSSSIEIPSDPLRRVSSKTAVFYTGDIEFCVINN